MEKLIKEYIKMTNELFEFAGNKAIYEGEPSTIGIGRMRGIIEKAIPDAVRSAVLNSIDTQSRMDAARGIDADAVVKEATKLSHTIANFAKDLERTTQATLLMAMKNTELTQSKTEVKNMNQTDFLDHFGIKANSAAPLFGEQETSQNKESKLGI